MFRIRNVRSDDPGMRDRAVDFLDANPDPGVRLRPARAVDEAVESGQGLIVLDGEEVVGLSLVYKFVVPPDDDVFSEIGTMRVVANGYDLQTFIARLHLVQLSLEEDLGGRCNVFAVVSPESASEHNLADKVGMEAWTPGEALAAARADAGVPFSEAKRVLAVGGGCVAAAFADLRGRHLGGSGFRTPKGDGRVTIEMGWFHPGVLDAGSTP